MKDAILRLKAPLRHVLALAAGVLLTWGATEVVPVLQDESNLTGGVLAAALTYLIGWATPLVSSYGVGADRARELGARQPGDSTVPFS